MEEEKIKPEMDQESGLLTDIQGQLLGFLDRFGYFSFSINGSKEIACFKMQSYFKDGERFLRKKSYMKNRLIQHCKDYQEVNARFLTKTHEKNSLVSKFKINENDDAIRPKWFANVVWVGEPEPPVKFMKSVEYKYKNVLEIKEIYDIPGKIEFVNKNSGIGFVIFKTPEGYSTSEKNKLTSTAQFTTYNVFVQGERLNKLNKFIQDTDFNSTTIRFNASFESKLTPYIQEKFDDGMETATKYEPEWTISCLWKEGDKPCRSPGILITSKSDPTIDEEIGIADKNCLRNIRYKESIKDATYFTGRLEQVLNDRRGIVATKDKPVSFNIQDLSIDGVQVIDEDDPISNETSPTLFNILDIGDILYGYCKIKGDDIEAVVIWKGRRKGAQSNSTIDITSISDTSGGPSLNVSSTMDDEKCTKKKKRIKSTFPMPWEATFTDLEGEIVETDGMIGKVLIHSEGDAHNNKRALFMRARTFIDGSKLKFRTEMYDHLTIGDKINLDVVPANLEESKGEYNYLAVLSWKGEKPKREIVSMELEVPNGYRAKVLKLEYQKGIGATHGVLTIISGPNSIGERILFNRENVYVFSARMAKADLSYVMKETDKVQVEYEPSSLEDQEISFKKYGCILKLKATCVWVGVSPKFDHNLDDFPEHVGPVVFPFLTKRNLDKESFTKIIRGEFPPKEIPITLNSRLDNDNNSIDSEVLPPNTIMGRIIELKKPDPDSNSGTEHGIIMIENGPYAKEKAFFNRNSLFCWGYNMRQSDLMYFVKETDKYCIEVQGGTNNKSIPFKVTYAWVGIHPNEKRKELIPSSIKTESISDEPPSQSSIKFSSWLASHKLDFETFMSCVKGEAPIKPFFPLPTEQQNARIYHLHPPKARSGVEFGVLRITQGSLVKNNVLFERDNVYIWNVQFKKGDLSYLFKEGDKVTCEVSEIAGKEKKKWQTRLGTPTIPKYAASLVCVGGARPKITKLHEPIEKMPNLKQWLNKRNISLECFKDMLQGNVPPKEYTQSPSQHFQDDQMEITYKNSQSSSNFSPSRGSLPPPPPPPIFTSNLESHSNPIRNNPVMKQAESLLHRVMLCSSPEDNAIKNIINDEKDLQLALFISKSLFNAIKFTKGGSGVPPISSLSQDKSSKGFNSSMSSSSSSCSSSSINDRPQQRPPPGPIGPPRPRPNRPLQKYDYHHHHPTVQRSSSGGGLYGLQQPLLSYGNSGNGGSDNSGYTLNQGDFHEPPYKRKFGEWDSK